MITLEQAQRGLTKYIDNDILPHINGLKKIGVGMYAALAIENLKNAYQQNKDNPVISMIAVFDENDMIDIDKVYDVVYPMFANGEKYTLGVPLVGEITFTRNDLEKIYSYMKE